jgi:hypothetical protein
MIEGKAGVWKHVKPNKGKDWHGVNCGLWPVDCDLWMDECHNASALHHSLDQKLKRQHQQQQP